VGLGCSGGTDILRDSIDSPLNVSEGKVLRYDRPPSGSSKLDLCAHPSHSSSLLKNSVAGHSEGGPHFGRLKNLHLFSTPKDNRSLFAALRMTPENAFQRAPRETAAGTVGKNRQPATLSAALLVRCQQFA
jgi:hypothetical protein